MALIADTATVRVVKTLPVGNIHAYTAMLQTRTRLTEERANRGARPGLAKPAPPIR
jgi:hypothetical protein